MSEVGSLRCMRQVGSEEKIIYIFLDGFVFVQRSQTATQRR